MNAPRPGPAFAALAAALLACSGMPKVQPAHGPPVQVEDLTGSAWKAEEIGGDPVPGEHPPMLYFESARAVSGFAGCNQFSGPVSGRSDDVRFGPLAATRRACEPPQMELEQRFLGALSQGPLRLQGGGGFLYLVDADESLVLRFLRHRLPDDDTGPS